MHHYTVLDVYKDDGRTIIALRDMQCKYHVARLHADIPLDGTTLQGAAPNHGFGLLADTTTGKIYRVIFECVDCGQEFTMELLHPEVLDPAFFRGLASH